nr:MAG TPA: hypothetical protein [Caudoviricetes sp.]
MDCTVINLLVPTPDESTSAPMRLWLLIPSFPVCVQKLRLLLCLTSYEMPQTLLALVLVYVLFCERYYFLPYRHILLYCLYFQLHYLKRSLK